MMKSQKLLAATAALALSAFALSCTLPARAEQKLNLAEKPDKPRFQTTDKVWPENSGDASICLWKDDKTAAFSFTVDDNTAPDVDWWLEQSRRLDFPITWFLITGRITDKPSFWGTWDQWRQVRQAGMGIESHTVTHLHVDEPDWPGIEREYSDSQRRLEENMPGHKVRTLAFPGGKNSKLNDRSVAAKYYIAARSTVGSINPVNQTDYFNIGSSAGWHVAGEKAPWIDLRNLLDKELYRGRGWRGWGVYLSHKADREGLPAVFDFLNRNRAEIWVGLFTDVAKYGQERDTATLRAIASTPERIAFEVADEMDDARFDFPLTVKVRVPDEWKKVRATQNKKPVAASVVDHAGARFALVEVVPDRGEIELAPQK